MSSQRIGIFVATMTGNAGLCAEEIGRVLEAEGIASEIQMMDGLGAEALAPYQQIVIVSSTYGQGDIPDNGQQLFEALETADGVDRVRFAVFGLGDRTYAATFCEGGRKWDTLLAKKGAIRFAPLFQHDASSGTLAEDEAARWASDWAPLLKPAASDNRVECGG
jgi:MioC protein